MIGAYLCVRMRDEKTGMTICFIEPVRREAAVVWYDLESMCKGWNEISTGLDNWAA
jgi:hypothetical protein